MKRKVAIAVAATAVALPGAAAVVAAVAVGPGGGEPGTSRNFELVGSNSLFNRGMNAAPAIYGDHMYVGNRTDGSSGHRRPGVLVVDIGDPANPEVVNEFGREFVTGENEGQTSRELRVWPREKLLMVMYFRCSSLIHDCPPGRPDEWSIRFFDLTDPIRPALVSTYVPSRKPHEMYLWQDPKNPARALLYLSTPSGSTNYREEPEVIVTDISRAREGVFREVAKGNWTWRYAVRDPVWFERCGGEGGAIYVHSMAPNVTGRRLYLAYNCGQMLIVDTEDLMRNRPNPRMRLISPILNRPRWGNPHAHSTVRIPGRPFVITTDEVYGDLLTPFEPPASHHGCPWGWSRIVNVLRPAHPRIVAEYKIEENRQSFCTTAEGQNDLTVSYASHNPTLTRSLALVTWHSGGLQAFTTRPASRPRQGGWFSPTPLDEVATEDPALSAGPNKVVMWSYPIVKDGLVYVVDVRNGLYVLRYTGPHASEVAELEFLEGNSNLGDAARIATRTRR